MRSFISIVFTALWIYSSQALTSSSIEGCPPLLPRHSPPKGVHDLRADDIKVVAALGDSIMAGFVAKGIQNNNVSSPDTSVEHRGVSWGGGGDDSELTIPNFIKHYSHGVKGASVGVHKEFCAALICLPQQYQPAKDYLNAAQSGSTVLNLEHEIGYLLAALKQTPGIDYENDWKLITLQIGSNDQCLSCTDDYADLLSAENFGREIDIAIDRIRTNVPHVLINLVDGANISNVHHITKGQTYCMPFKNSELILNSIECPCNANEETRKMMDKAAAGYTAQLYRVYEKYRHMGGDDFGIMYSPDSCDFSNWPVQAFSNFDCFHPSVLGHQFTAKSIWNSMFKPLVERPLSTPWNPDLEIYCPNETDRLRLD